MKGGRRGDLLERKRKREREKKKERERGSVLINSKKEAPRREKVYPKNLIRH